MEDGLGSDCFGVFPGTVGRLLCESEALFKFPSKYAFFVYYGAL